MCEAHDIINAVLILPPARVRCAAREAPRYNTPAFSVEGILVLEDAALRNLMDLRIFVDTDAEERLARRILRLYHVRISMQAKMAH